MPLAKPRWLRVPLPGSEGYRRMDRLVREHALGTVCQAANCPNIGGCWEDGAAAFMILGTVCTRGCGFCNVTAGRPAPADPGEPERLAEAVIRLGLRHVVITSVTRDDLPDGGAAQFAACVTALRARNATITIELLTPDFRRCPEAAERVFAAAPEVFNHNVETVPRLYPAVRAGADYKGSLTLLARAAAHGLPMVKSGIMLGLGEEEEEILAVMADLRANGVTALTIGQYLAPSRAHLPVVRYWPPDFFTSLRARALAMGFARVESHPLARSSLHAQAGMESKGHCI
ncbi:MAG: lipoyl synthase [Magnetococcales bacterium]|nr:lipoyl synthase [Magnetococcales bacterium]